ncbi:hypothetical protein FACS189425_06910 [Clostridia bacterium]|nr:hypothetical protein FACS189425_06910 [Clostridia bacterium]
MAAAVGGQIRDDLVTFPELPTITQQQRDFAPTVAMICSALGNDYNFNYFINRLVRDGTYRMSERQRSLAQSYRMSPSGLPF